MKLGVLLDALYLNGPFISELKENKMGFIITAKDTHQSHYLNNSVSQIIKQSMLPKKII